MKTLIHRVEVLEDSVKESVSSSASDEPKSRRLSSQLCVRYSFGV